MEWISEVAFMEDEAGAEMQTDGAVDSSISKCLSSDSRARVSSEFGFDLPGDTPAHTKLFGGGEGEEESRNLPWECLPAMTMGIFYGCWRVNKVWLLRSTSYSNYDSLNLVRKIA